MFVRNKADSRTREVDGLKCHLLLEENDVRGDQIAVTWVDVEPRARQRMHRHVPQQVYVIVAGEGRMTVGNQEREVHSGDIIYVPSNVLHGIENTSYSETLTYITSATPAFDVSALFDVGEHMAESELTEA